VVSAVASAARCPTRDTASDRSPGSSSPALTVYSRTPGGLDEGDRHIALLLATHASLAAARTRTAEIGELRSAHLRTALVSRDVIGQAKGILMAKKNIDAEAAFDILRRTSQQLNTKLSEIAETLARRQSEL